MYPGPEPLIAVGRWPGEVLAGNVQRRFTLPWTFPGTDIQGEDVLPVAFRRVGRRVTGSVQSRPRAGEESKREGDGSDGRQTSHRPFQPSLVAGTVPVGAAGMVTPGSTGSRSTCMAASPRGAGAAATVSPPVVAEAAAG